MDEFLTIPEIAALLQLNPQTIYNWIDRKELPAIRAGARRGRVRRADLDAFLEAGETVKRQAPELAEVDEGSVTAWATFGAAMAETTAALETTEREAIVAALDGLAGAVRDLADALRPDG